MKTMKRIFGVRQVGFFTTRIIIDEGGFIYKGRPYAWKDIIAIKRSDDFFDSFMRHPSTSVLLNDGVIMRFPITLEEKCIKNKSNFFEWSSKSDSYKCLINLLEDKAHKNKISFMNYIYSSNQIMAYRMSIIVGLGFNLIPLLVIFGFGAKFTSTMLFPMCSGIILILAGSYSLVKRRLNESYIIKELHKSS